MAQSKRLTKKHKQVNRPKVKQPHNPGAPRKIVARELELHALELRKQGYTYPEIGVKLGVPMITAYQAIARVLAAYEEQIKELCSTVRQIELERLDRMTQKLQRRINAGDDKAIGCALRIMERRAKLLGLDAPLEIDHSGTIEVKMTDEQLDAEIRQLVTMLGVIAAPAAEPEPTGKTDAQKIDSTCSWTG